MSIEGLNQVQVNSEIGLDFAAVLRSILRQDPNIILIGEIRDSETAKIAVRASITGHLVLSTLHTNNSITTIERLVDMEVERYLLSSSLKGIISQTLAKRLCPRCRIQRPANETEKTLYKKALGVDIETIYEAGRCEHCHNGYTGRIALQEVLMINDEIREAINKNIDREELKKLIYTKNKNVRNLLQDGLIKAMQGITDLKEVFRLVDDDDYDDISGDIAINVNQAILDSTNQVSVANNDQNVVPVPNNQNQAPTNQIMEPVQDQTAYANQTQNLFDDNVFNSLRNQDGTVNTSNYTNNLVNMINQNMTPEQQVQTQQQVQPQQPVQQTVQVQNENQTIN